MGAGQKISERPGAVGQRVVFFSGKLMGGKPEFRGRGGVSARNFYDMQIKKINAESIYYPSGELNIKRTCRRRTQLRDDLPEYEGVDYRFDTSLNLHMYVEGKEFPFEFRGDLLLFC